MVTEDDILAGEFTNTATAKGDPIPDPKNPDTPKVPEGEDTVTTGDDDPDNPTPPIEEKNGHLTVSKKTTSEPANGETYALGETITYEVTATNDGNLTITDVTVTDELTEDEWTIASLAPGASETFEAEHEVTEADILAGNVVNNATAKGTSPDPDKPEVPVTPGTTEDEPDDLDTTLTVNKTISNEPANGEAYVLGETIEYTITVTNDGNATYKNVKVEDEATGFSTTIAELAVGETQTFTTTHVVTEDDILAGEFTNTVTAKGNEIPDPKDPENPKVPEGEDTVTTGDEDDPDGPTPPIEDKNGHMTVTKVTTSETPADGYALGDTIEYKITVVNDGNLTLTEIKVTDELTGDEWSIDSLAPGESKDFEASYTVTREDVDAGSVVNVATADGISPDPDKPKPEVTPGTKDEPTRPIYVIIYDPNGGNFNGSTDDIREEHMLNEVITIHEAPTREGYTFDYWKGSEYQPGDKYTVVGNHTFVAQWKKNAEPAPAPQPAKPARKLPQTSDPTNFVAMGALAAAGVASIASGMVIRRRKDEDED